MREVLMLELIQHNPFISFLIFLIPIIAGIWKLFDVLYVKPRDFRISVLEKNIKELRAAQRVTEPARTDSAMQDDKTNGINFSKLVETDNSLDQEAKLLHDMAQFYRAWKNKTMTDLQRSQYERIYLGQKVIWRARIQSVSEERDGLLWVGLNPEKEHDYDVHVIAVFEPKHKEALLMLKKGEIILVTGTIDSFFLAPILKHCEVIRT